MFEATKLNNLKDQTGEIKTTKCLTRKRFVDAETAGVALRCCCIVSKAAVGGKNPCFEFTPIFQEVRFGYLLYK